MYNAIKPKNSNQLSIHALALIATRALSVIDRNKSITAIAVYEQTLGPKVGRFMEARNDVTTHVRAYRGLAVQSAAEIGALDDVTRVWGTNIQLGTSLDSEDLGISYARTPEAVMDNAQNAMQVLREHGELPLAAQALSEIESKHSIAKAAYDAAQAGRVAVQVKQHELHAVAADVHKELVKLRRVARIVLGSSHLDYQRLRVRNARPGTEALDVSTEQTAEGSSDASAAARSSP